MSMVKIIPSGSYSFAAPCVELVKMSSRGLRGSDLGEFIKRAGDEIVNAIHNLKFEKGEVPIHLIALGSTEFYGCLAAGSLVRMWDGKFKPIEQIIVGDEVLSAEGKIRPVTHTWRRTSDSTINLRVCGLPDNIISSPNHPFRVARHEQFTCDHDKYKRCLPPTQGKQNICNRTCNTRDCVVAAYREIHAEWATADSLRAGDFLIWTAPQLEPLFNISIAEGYLLGAWLAEGSFQRNPSNKAVASARLSLGWSEVVFRQKLQEVCSVLSLTCNVYDYKDTKGEQVLTVTGNPALFRLWHQTFGEHALHKYLPPWLCNLPKATRLAIFAGYLDGDGCCVVDERENRTTAKTMSRNLALGMQQLGWSLGFPVVCCSVTSGGWSISVANSYLEELSPFSWKVKGRDLKQTSKIHVFCHKGRTYLPIRELVCDGPADVFNLEVDIDNTYSGFVDSHNSNRNGDGFSKNACRRYHDTFVKHARFYRQHQNKDPRKSYGIVKHSSYNDAMNRIELIVALNGTKEAAIRNNGLIADKEMDVLNSDPDNFGVSMACRVAHDVCSCCGNKARTRADYCTEKTCKYGGCASNLCKVAADGKILYVDNPHPTWFDISNVSDTRPADRIAYVFGKVKTN